MRSNFHAIAAALLMMAASAGPATAEPQAKGAATMPQQNEQILEELKAIRRLLERMAVPAPVPAARPASPAGPVTLATLPTDFALGRADAPVTIVEFTDLQCSFCRQFHVGVFDQLKREYVDTGKVRFISRDLPLSAIHPLAVASARVSRCAGEQGKFWEMRHAILANNTRLSADMFITFGQDLGLDVAKMIQCTNDSTVLDQQIKADMDLAAGASLVGTPAFVIGRTEAVGITGDVVMGSLPFAAFEEKIKALLPR